MSTHTNRDKSEHLGHGAEKKGTRRNKSGHMNPTGTLGIEKRDAATREKDGGRQWGRNLGTVPAGQTAVTLRDAILGRKFPIGTPFRDTTNSHGTNYLILGQILRKYGTQTIFKYFVGHGTRPKLLGQTLRRIRDTPQNYSGKYFVGYGTRPKTTRANTSSDTGHAPKLLGQILRRILDTPQNYFGKYFGYGTRPYYLGSTSLMGHASPTWRHRLWSHLSYLGTLSHTYPIYLGA